MVLSSVLGFPRIGANREFKKALDRYLNKTSGLTEAELIEADDDLTEAADDLTEVDLTKAADDLTEAATEVKKASWTGVKCRGVDHVPSGEFSLYDHVLDHSVAFNVIPERYTELKSLDLYFAMGRGRQRDGVDVPGCEMKAWFGTNYFYVVPEFSENTDFKLVFNKAVREFKEAQAANVQTRPVVLGPISFLVLGKAGEDAQPGFQPVSLLPKLIPIYVELLGELKTSGAEWVQVDEPVLVLDRAATLEKEFANTYAVLSKAAPKILLTTYFGRLDSNLTYVAKLPIAGLHIDLDRAPGQLDEVLVALKPTKILLSLGLVSGRNIWKTDFATAIAQGQKAIKALGKERVIIATSSSLLHIPVSLTSETKLTKEQKGWFSFALEKASEVANIAAVLSGSKDPAITAALEANEVSIAKRREFEKQPGSTVPARVASITSEQLERKSRFPVRMEIQAKHLNLPIFPTTSVGSFPQTKEIRQARDKFNKGLITPKEYEAFIAKEIESAIRFQERISLDLLVHGEPERTDKVQYLCEQLLGFVFTQNGWVQSYGSLCTRSPIIVSDISRPHPMTVKLSSDAQSLTKKPMKGMLTGPVTILHRCFPRADISTQQQSKQLALALRDEVSDLEKAGISAIQVDEPAIHEGLPLRRSDWDDYLKWAVDSWKLSTACVDDCTQIHAHLDKPDFDCHSIFDSIQRLDADVIAFEASDSRLEAFKRHEYTNQIGPGVYNTYSPRIPPEKEIKDRLKLMLGIFKDPLLFVNPDSILKPRSWKEVEDSLINLVEAAKWARENLKRS